MIPLVIGAGAAIAAAGYGLWRIGSVSRGTAIPAGRTGRALVIIDMQTGFMARYPDAPAVKARIIERAERARSEGVAIIAIQQVWRTAMGTAIGMASGGAGLPSHSGTPIDPEIAQCADHILVKNLQDAFHKPDLDDLLAELGIGTLEICGLDGVYCVRATVMAALNRGYLVDVDPALVLSTQQDRFQVMHRRWPRLEHS